MYYLYLLFSPSHEKHYVGISDNPRQRLLTHNTTERNTFTSKYRPWELAAVFEVGSLENARSIENFIKRQKSRELLEKLADPAFQPTGRLAQLVRVPALRD
jgi:putative endonuclease